MPAALVQRATPVPVLQGTTATATFATATTAGNLVVLHMGCREPGTTDASFTDPTGMIRAVSVNPDKNQSVIWYRENAPATTSIVLNWSTPIDVVVVAEEWTGVATSSSLDKTASASDTAGSATASSGTTATTAQGDELVLSTIASSRADADQTAPTNSFTQSTYTETSGGASTSTQKVGVGTYYRIVSSTGAYGHDVTLATARPWSGVVATFRAAGGGGGTNVPATVAQDLGALAGSVAATVAKAASVTQQLGGLSATVAATRSVTAVIAQDLGALSGTVVASTSTPSGSTDHPAVVAQELGGLTAAVVASRSTPASVAQQLGGLSATVVTVREVSAVAAQALGALTGTVVAQVSTPSSTAASVAVELGGLVATVVAHGRTPTPSRFEPGEPAGRFSSSTAPRFSRALRRSSAGPRNNW